MPDEKKTASKEKQGQKMVPLAELVDYRKKTRITVDGLKGQLKDAETRISGLEDEIKVVGADMEDDEKIKNVRTYLLSKRQELDGDRAKHNKVVTELEERERTVAAKELVAEFRAKGVEVDAETLMDEEEPRLKCMELYAAQLEQGTAEKEETEGKTPEVFETGPQGVIKKMPVDMTDEEFTDFEKTIKADHYAKK